LHLRQVEPDHVLCEISVGDERAELYDISATSDEFSVVEAIKVHPGFQLAQRTVRGCGGKLTIERDSDSQSCFRLLLPRNALNSPAIEEPKR